MNPQVVQIATELVSGLLAARRLPSMRWPLVALGGVIALIGVVFLAIAADLALEERMSPPAAAAVVGGVLVVMALILIWGALRRRTTPRHHTEELPIAALTEFATGLLGDFEEAIQASPKSSAVAAFAAGCVVGSTPGLQRGLRDLIH